MKLQIIETKLVNKTDLLILIVESNFFADLYIENDTLLDTLKRYNFSKINNIRYSYSGDFIALSYNEKLVGTIQ